MLEIKKGIGGEEAQPIKVQYRNLSPITLNQQHQSQQRNLQKSNSPLRENNFGSFEIKINKITNPLYNVGAGNQLVVDQSPQQMNKKLINIFETRQFQKNISAQEYRQQKDDVSSYCPSVPSKMNKNEMKRVLIRQGLQGNFNQQFQNKNYAIKLSDKDNLNQLKALNQSIDLSILPKNNIIQEEIQFKSHREKNAILPSQNIKTITKNIENGDNLRGFYRKEELNNTQKMQANNNNITNISSNKLKTHESSISCDVSIHKSTQHQQAQLQNLADFNKVKTCLPNQTKVALQFEQIVPNQYQENDNKKQLQKVFSKTKTQFENFSDQFIKKPQAGSGIENNIQLKNQIQNNRNKTQKQSPIQRDEANTLDYDLKEQFIQKQKQDSKDFLPLHLKILEEYQNDTLIKKDPSPQIPNCQITIQKTQLAKKYQLFLRNQKNKTIIAQKSSLTPQKLPYGKLISNESNGLIISPDKLPEIKQNSISERVGEIFDSNRRDSADKLELNLQIRKLDTDVDPKKANKQKSKSVHQNTQIKFQKQKFCNNAERFYRLFAKNQMNSQNNRLYTEQLNSSQNNYSQLNQNNLYSDEFIDAHLEDASASNGLAQELSTASVLDAKNISELNIHRLLEKQKNKKIQNLQISSPNLFPNQNLQQNKSQVSQINILNDEEKPSKIQMNERKSQKLIQFLQLQPQQQKQQYLQQNQLVAQQRQQYNFTSSQADQYQNQDNNYQVSQSANSQHYDYSQLYFSKDGHISSIPIQNNQQDYNFNKKILRQRNQSGVSQNTNKYSPRRAIQVSRLDLSTNTRDQVYYSLNTSENYRMNQNQEYSIHKDEQIQNNQQNEIGNIIINISKTMNTVQNENDFQLQEISKSLVHQTPQPLQRESKDSDSSFLQHMYFNRNLNAFRKKKKSKQQNQEIQITETGFGDDNLNQQSILNGFSIEDYVSEMKSEQKSEIKTEKNQRKKK
ncbi:hypothetical protein ABPG74_016370 [Tetrahymena malaccensis]